jgi:electron-transferring-flavoprotein dehydrogenase
MAGDRVSVGLLTGLDYEDPYLDPHLQFQKFKMHPVVAEILKDGEMVQYGAKTVPVGGYYAIPKLAFDGGLIAGDSAGLFISQKIKGVHTAVKSGMLAAEAIYQALVKKDYSAAQLQGYQKDLMDSYVGRDLYKARNFHQAFQKGLWMGLFKAGLQYILGGRVLASRLRAKLDFTHQKKVKDLYGTDSVSDEQKGLMKFDGKQTFDKETDVYYSGTIHEEQQPAHLKIADLDVCYTTCTEQFQNPCLRFCPANVYEMEVDEDSGQRAMKINFSNCLHCKTCDVKDPFENIEWVPPEGGGGPKYTVM